MSSPYPSRQKISEIFASLAKGQYDDFFAHVADDVDWTVMGHHPLAGQYHDKKDFQKRTFGRLSGIMKEPVQLEVRSVIGGGDEEWAVVELIADSTCKNGLKFDNTYAWVCRWNKDGQIVQVRAYLDSALVKQAIEENEESHDG